MPSITVTLHETEDVFPVGLTVIVVVPVAFAVTLPSASTVATEVLLDVHVKSDTVVPSLVVTETLSLAV